MKKDTFTRILYIGTLAHWHISLIVIPDRFQNLEELGRVRMHVIRWIILLVRKVMKITSAGLGEQKHATNMTLRLV